MEPHAAAVARSAALLLVREAATVVAPSAGPLLQARAELLHSLS